MQRFTLAEKNEEFSSDTSDSSDDEQSVKNEKKPEELEEQMNLMITGDLKERFFSDEEADREIEEEIKDSNLVKEKCIKDADYLYKYLTVRCKEIPSMLVIEEIIYIIEMWNKKGKLCLEHDLIKPQIRNFFWHFIERIFANINMLQYHILNKIGKLLIVMKQRTGVFNFQNKNINEMEIKLKKRLDELEKIFNQKAIENIKLKKKRKLIRKMKRKNKIK